MLAQGESGPVLCFVCQTDLTSLQLRQRTTHVEQCLGLPDYEANEVPRDTLGGASAPIEIPDEELSDFKEAGGGARKVANSTTKRSGTTLTMLWNLPAGKTETTMAKLAPATEPASLPVAPTPVAPPLPSLPSFQLPDHVRAKFQQTRLQHLHQSTGRRVTGPETEAGSSNALAKPVTTTRRGGARQQVKSTDTRPDPELDLALALSASLSRQNSTPNKTRSAATGKLRRSKSAKISAAVKGGATRSEAKEKPFSITGDCDDGNEKRDAAANCHPLRVPSVAPDGEVGASSGRLRHYGQSHLFLSYRNALDESQ
ncbi:hypothetical protein IWQ60_004870 [Tieghemiomyces parasiticus]|uniref:Uncharacterized protein n=1 Tax=Tieghemiomyces parasiticus TaxID=78921 RepID=A0A9W8DYR9_9FUNG|nr:hypothetical protein IWQ60_004870 [Tieghemiomyces parasiticus]